ncbi:MAG: hypothetical protein R3D29_15890 [Nitratireductor sp.]
MIIKKLLATAGVLAIAAATSLGVTSMAKAADFTIKVAFPGSPEDEDYDGSMVFKDYVESRSNGRAAVEIYPSGQFCGNEKECLEPPGWNAGSLYHDDWRLRNVFGPGQVLDLPYMFANDRIAECV